MKFTVMMTGVRPLLMHNGRLANPIDPHTRALKQLTGKRRKTDDDLIAIMQTEARGAIYETDDDTLGFPTQNVWRCIYDAAKAYRRGEDIKRALFFDDVIEPLTIGGEFHNVDEFLRDPHNIDYRSVKVQRARTMRARPIVREWETAHTFDLLEDVLDPRELTPILDYAARLVGVGDWRPTYGTFNVEVAAQ